MSKNATRALLICSNFILAIPALAYGPDCYDSGGSNEICSGGNGGAIGWVAFTLIVGIIFYGYLNDRLTRKAINVYLLLIGLFILGAKTLGADIAACYFVAAAFIYYYAAEKKPSADKSFPGEESHSNQEEKITASSSSITPTVESPLQEAVDNSCYDPNKTFKWPPGTWMPDWFDMRYPPRIDPERDRSADFAQELCEELYGLDSQHHRMSVKFTWLVGYEEGRYAALGITKRNRNSSFLKAQDEFNLYEEEYKEIFFEGYDEALKKLSN